VDWIEEVDWACGRVLDTVRELGISDRTLVFFASDNGGAGAANNAPLRGQKGSTWEGGVRVPFLAWWPGHVPAGVKSAEIATTMDILPTIVRLCGGTVRRQRTIDGLDILPLLTTKDAKSPRDTFFYFHGGADALEAVRHGPWKYAIVGQIEGLGKKAEDKTSVPALYNLETDIGEQTDVVDQHPEIVAEMKKLIESMVTDLGIDKKAGPGVRPCATVENPIPLRLTGEAKQ
jgi:arylsulfatase A